MENRIAFNITEAEKEDILKAVETLKDKLQPLLIALDKRDKQMLAKMSDKSIPFVEKVMQYMKTNPEFVPPFINVTEAENDFKSFTDLREFLRPLLQMTDNLDDTETLAGSETWQASLAFYNSVKSAAKLGVLDAQAIYEDLRPRFEAQRVKANPPARS